MIEENHQPLALELATAKKRVKSKALSIGRGAIEEANATGAKAKPFGPMRA